MTTQKSPDWTDFGELQAELVGLESHREAVDPRALRLSAVLAFGRRTSLQPTLDLLLQDAVALVNSVLGGDLAGIGEVGPNGKTLTLKVATIDKKGDWHGTKVHKSALDATDSMAAYALNSAAPTVTEALVRERRFSDLFLRHLGVVGALTIPLHIAGKPYGVLGVYSNKTRQFDDSDVQFAETIGHLLSSSSGRIRAEFMLRRERRVADTIRQNIRSLVIEVDPDGLVRKLNTAAEKTTKFSQEELVGRPFWEKLAIAREQDLIESFFRSARNDRTPCEFESILLSKDGGTRRVSWSLQPIYDDRKRLESIVLTGDDRTEIELIEEELQSLRGGGRDDDPETDETAGGWSFGSSNRPDPVDDAGDLQEEPKGAEQRSSPRRAYRYQQAIAPIYNGQIPTRRHFATVECRDISAGGIAFVLDTVPDFTDLVVALGRSPQLTHFTATVARTCEIDDEGRKRYLVGCRFTGRINL